jgi:predicted outer membrane repeat protein
LSGGNAVALFQVFASATLTLANITVTRGFGPAGAIENFGELHATNASFVSNTTTQSGGAIVNHGALVLSNVTVSANTAAAFGGAIQSDAGSLTITSSRFVNNTAFSGGGAIAATAGTATVEASEFVGNRATDTLAQGGAIRSADLLTVGNSTFRDNYASRGGALFVASGASTVSGTLFRGNSSAFGGGVFQADGTFNVADSYFAYNGYDPKGTRQTSDGGAISQAGGITNVVNVTMHANWGTFGGAIGHAGGTTSLSNVTISGNLSAAGGAVSLGTGSIALTNVTIVSNTASTPAGGIIDNRGAGTVTVKNVVLANPGSRNCYAAIPAPSFSNSSDGTCGFGAGRDGQTLKFEPLQDNGGTTFTRVPYADNPVIDNGTGMVCPAYDQRDVARPVGLACDVGAVEFVAGRASPRWDVFWRRNDGTNATWQFNGSQLAAGFPPGVETTWSAVAAADVNGDRVDDVIWLEPASGQVAIWLMASPTAVAGVAFPASVGQGTGWVLAAAGDVDRDGYADLVWRNAFTGQLLIWYLTPAGAIASVRDYGVVPLSYELRGAGDVRGDGAIDLLWFRPSDGQVVIWWMGSDGSFTARFPGAVGPGSWRPYLMADFDGDSIADILWRNEANGATAVWYMTTSATMVGEFLVSVPLPEWTLGSARDIDFDGKADLIWYGPASGNVVRWRMQGRGVAPIAESLPAVGTGWNVVR